MKLPGRPAQDIRVAALLHDIGKLGIPDEVLNKPGRLTADEYELVKTHPDIGVNIPGKILDFATICHLVHCHHEYYDGSGYPNGLSGSDIPIGGQIIQITDAFDAMTSKRAYRNPFTRDKALQIIIEEAGHPFHSNIASTFIELMENYLVEDQIIS